MLAGEVPESANSSADCQGGNLNRKPGSGEPTNKDAPLLAARQFLDALVNKIRDCHADDAHIEDVGAQHQQPAVLKDQRLHAHHGGHHQDGGPGAKQNRGERRAHQVPGSAAQHSEIQHLPGEDSGRQDAHHRYFALIQVGVDAFEGDRHHKNGHDPHHH